MPENLGIYFPPCNERLDRSQHPKIRRCIIQQSCLVGPLQLQRLYCLPNIGIVRRRPAQPDRKQQTLARLFQLVHPVTLRHDTVCPRQRVKDRERRCRQCQSRAERRSPPVPHPSQPQYLFRNLTRHETQAPRPRQHLHPDTTSLASHIKRDSMHRPTTTLPTPTTPTDRNNIQLRLDSPLVDSRPDLASLPLPQPDIAIPIPDGHDRPEARSLPRVGLLLHEANAQNLLLDVRQQGIHNLRLLDPQPLREDLLHRHNLALLHLPAQLRLRDPADLLARTLTHQEAPNDADTTFFLTCSKCPDKSSGFNPRPRYR